MRDNTFSVRLRAVNRRRKLASGRVKRSSVVSMLAYQSGSKIYDERAGITRDYSHKEGVLDAFAVGCGDEPAELLDSTILANRIELAERRKNAKLCRVLIISLPHWLTVADQNICLRQIAAAAAQRYRTVVMGAHHAPDQAVGHDKRNWHGHLLIPRRQITQEGYLETNPSIDVLDDNETSAAELKWLRETAAAIQNAMLASRGFEHRVEHLSYQERGLEIIPTQHRGPGGQAMEGRAIRPESKIALDAMGKVVNWPEIDRGQTRSELNVNIAGLNLERDAFGKQPLSEQIHDLEKLIEILIERITDLGSVIPEAMLPPWARRMLHAMRSIMERIIMQKIEAEAASEEREVEKKRRLGLHERMRRMEVELKEMKEALARRKALEGFYLRLQLTVASMPPIKADIEPPRRVISHAQYNLELHFKAETARAQVPPEYRPRIERPSVSLPDNKTGQGAFTAAVARPPDNGGLAKMPPPLTGNFNTQADPPAYRQQVKLAFGIK